MLHAVPIPDPKHKPNPKPNPIHKICSCPQYFSAFYTSDIRTCIIPEAEEKQELSNAADMAANVIFTHCVTANWYYVVSNITQELNKLKTYLIMHTHRLDSIN